MVNDSVVCEKLSRGEDALSHSAPFLRAPFIHLFIQTISRARGGGEAFRWHSLFHSAWLVECNSVSRFSDESP